MGRYLAKVLVKDGNRMLVPGLWHADGEDATSVLFDALMYECVLGATAEPDWLEVDTDDSGQAQITNVAYRLVGPQFAHGAIDVALIGGPLFDAAQAAA